MIISMVDVDAKKQSILFVVIEKDNLDRMAKADPITLESIPEGGMLPAIKYPQNFSILIAYEPDSEELYRQGKRGGLNLLGWLERGRKFIKGLDGKEHTFKMPKEPN